MKHFVELTNDCIIQYKFYPDRVDDKIQWVDESNSKAKGKHVVDGVTILLKEVDQNGYFTGKLNSLWVSKSDILELAKKITHIDSAADVTGIPDDDLPF
jgi:hypothetical protein